MSKKDIQVFVLDAHLLQRNITQSAPVAFVERSGGKGIRVTRIVKSFTQVESHAD